MKFVALLMISAVAADDAKITETAAGTTCADATKTKCMATDCCGTVTDGATPAVKANEAVLLKGFAATVCAKKPTDDEIKTDAKGTPFTVQVAVEASADGVTPVVVKADLVAGTFLCNAAAEATDAASYMTVGAAAIIAAATLLQ